MRIDIHTHYDPPEFHLRARKKGGVRWAETQKDHAGAEFLVIKGRRYGPLSDRLYDPERRLADMDSRKVDAQAVSLSPYLFYYWGEARPAKAHCRLVNDSIAKLVHVSPKRFYGLAAIPLQDAKLAIEELKRASLELGFKGAEIRSVVDGKDLDHESLAPFFGEAEKLGCLVFIHPDYQLRRLRRHYMTNLVGNPFETTVAIASIIFGGVLERFPALRLCFAHAGGFTPYQYGRFDHGYEIKEQLREKISKPPSVYLKELYFDSIAHSPDALTFLIRSRGADGVMMGSDYPFPMGDDRPVNTIEALEISRKEKDMVLGGNVARLLGVKPSKL